MPIPILICDDSSVARKQVVRILPKDWEFDVTFASNGIEALAAIKAGKGDILFLDLNMPGMDGYEVLQAIRAEDLPTIAIVVSTDIQQDARQRVMQLGALAFVEKPIDEHAIASILRNYGIYQTQSKRTRNIGIDIDIWDGIKEIANVSMGQAADLLARLLNVFVVMPIPAVKMINPSDLQTAIRRFAGNNVISLVSQGFSGSYIAGEALVVFNDTSSSELSELLKYKSGNDDYSQQEQLTEVASLVTGACLKGISEQMDVRFGQGYPMMLGHRLQANNILSNITTRWDYSLAIELDCILEKRRTAYDLFLLFTEDSIPALSGKVSHLFG